MISRLYVYRTENHVPYQNLAVEEYLTLHTEPEECILFLWQNQNTVVIGKNQNCWKECRVDALEESGGSLVRRLSGGGAVYHDLGNLNFTFCVRKADYDLARQLDVILKAVKYFGIEAEKTGRNDITVKGRKFSGNAFYQSGDFCYHHGTLLIRADQEKLSKYLNVSKEKLKSKGVDSVRSRVVNLADLAPEITVDDLADALVQSFSEVYGRPVKVLPKNRLDWEDIREKEQRFSAWEWKYGRNLPFQHQMEQRFAWGEIELQFDIRQGIVQHVNAFSDGMEQEIIGKLSEVLTGCRYDKEDLSAALQSLNTLEENMELSDQGKQILRDIDRLIREQL